MDLILSIGSTLLGFTILLFGGNWLVMSAVNLASRLKISPSVIGLTVVAAGTSLPEMITSIMANYKESPDIAVGNVVGSNIFNILAILGVSSLIRVNRVVPNQIYLEIPFVIFISALLWFFSMDGSLLRGEGLLFLAMFVSFMTFSVIRSRRNYSSDINNRDDKESMGQLKHLGLDIGYLTLGTVALMGGAHFALDGSIHLARLLGLSERFIGLTIVSVGTGLPELATSSVAAFRGKGGIAVGNVVGSNLFNTLMVIGGAATYRSLDIHPQMLTMDFPWMVGITGALVPAYFIGKKNFNRPIGIAFLITYITYLTLLYYSQGT